MSTPLIVMIILAVLFDFLNGIHDSSNIVATMIFVSVVILIVFLMIDFLFIQMSFKKEPYFNLNI